MAVFEDRFRPDMEVNFFLIRINILFSLWPADLYRALYSCDNDVACVDQEEEAKSLVRDAIAAGIFNDLGSGSNIDLCVITKGKVDYLRPHDVANKKGVR